MKIGRGGKKNVCCVDCVKSDGGAFGTRANEEGNKSTCWGEGCGTYVKILDLRLPFPTDRVLRPSSCCTFNLSLSQREYCYGCSLVLTPILFTN